MRNLLLLGFLTLSTLSCAASSRNGDTPFGGTWIGQFEVSAFYDIDGHTEKGTFRDFWTVEQQRGAVTSCVFLCFLGTVEGDIVVFDNTQDPIRFPAMVPNQFQQVVYEGWADTHRTEIHFDVHDYVILADGSYEKLYGVEVDWNVTVEKAWDYSRSIHDF